MHNLVVKLPNNFHIIICKSLNNTCRIVLCCVAWMFGSVRSFVHSVCEHSIQLPRNNCCKIRRHTHTNTIRTLNGTWEKLAFSTMHTMCQSILYHTECRLKVAKLSNTHARTQRRKHGNSFANCRTWMDEWMMCNSWALQRYAVWGIVKLTHHLVYDNQKQLELSRHHYHHLEFTFYLPVA